MTLANEGPPELGAWEPPPGAIAEYERLWTPTSDAPRIYHIASSLALLAAIVENRWYLPFGGDRLYPNVWVLILGPSSFFRKSSSIAKAKRLLIKVNEGALLPDEFSREALVKRLSRRAQGLLTYSEFSGVLATFSKDYMSGTKELLTDLYDCPPEYTRIVGKEELTAHGVCVSILAASQTGWFLEKLKAGDIRGGFMARFSFWPAFDKKRFVAIPPQPHSGDAHALYQHLQMLAQARCGACALGAGVETAYTRWLETHERELHGHPRCDDLSPFWSRLSIMTLKFAMLLQLSHDADPCITVSTMESALALTDFLKRALTYLFAEEFAFTREQQDRQRVLRTVIRHPEIRLQDLYRFCHLSKREMTAALETLVAEGRIRHATRNKVAMIELVND